MENRILLLNPRWSIEKTESIHGTCQNVINTAGYPVSWDLTHPILNTKISVFYAPITNIFHKKDLTVFEVYHLIKFGRFKKETSDLRSIKDDTEKSRFKKYNFNYATFSGVFKRRIDNDLITHSGLICIDIDHLGSKLDLVRTEVKKIPSLVLGFQSPSGEGLKAVFKIDPKKYSQEKYYTAISNLVAERCHLQKKQLDPSCKNLSRACFLPDDPDIFINPKLLKDE